MTKHPKSSFLCFSTDDDDEGISDIELPSEMTRTLLPSFELELNPSLDGVFNRRQSTQNAEDLASPAAASGRQTTITSRKATKLSRKSKRPQKNGAAKKQTLRFKSSKSKPGLNGISLRVSMMEESKRFSMSSIPKGPFQKLVREIAYDFKENIRFQTASLDALREASESFLISVFEDANLCTLHANRVTLFPSDLKLALKLGDHHVLGNIYSSNF